MLHTSNSHARNLNNFRHSLSIVGRKYMQTVENPLHKHMKHFLWNILRMGESHRICFRFVIFWEDAARIRRNHVFTYRRYKQMGWNEFMHPLVYFTMTLYTTALGDYTRRYKFLFIPYTSHLFFFSGVLFVLARVDAKLFC